MSRISLRFALPLGFLFLNSVCLFGQSYSIFTFAGTGTAGYSGDGGSAGSAALNAPFGDAIDSAGNLYIADTANSRIRRVTGLIISTVAGDGKPGYSGDQGPATSAQLTGPFGVAIDSSGNLYIADTGNDVVRKVTNGTINTLISSGRFTSGPAPAIQLTTVAGLAVDSAGNLYLVDEGSNRVLKYSNGTLSVFAGNGTAGYSGDNGPATSAMLNSPSGIAVDASGNVLVADRSNNRIREISNGTITTVAGTGTAGFGGDSGPANSALLSNPSGVAVDTAGSLYIADTSNVRIRKISAGVITTIAGNGSFGFSGDNGPALNATFSAVEGLAVDSRGSVYVVDFGNSVIRLLSPGSGTTGLTITTSSLPGGTVNQSYAPVTLTASGGTGQYSWSSSTLPAGLTLTTGGLVSGTPTSSGQFSVTVTVTSGPNSVSATFSLTIAGAQTLQIPGGGGLSPITLTGVTVLNPYSQTLPATGGRPSYSWSLIGGALPSGLSLNGSGALSGVPTKVGGATFTAKVTDTAGASASSIFVLNVLPQPLTITTASPLPNGIVGSPYPPQVPTAVGGIAPYTFNVSGLPAGLSVTAGGTQIGGTPTNSGNFTLSVNATDSSSPAQTASTQLQLAVSPAHTDLLLSQAALSFTVTNGATGLPPGARISVESNTPSQILSYSVTVSPGVSWLTVKGGGTAPGGISIGLNPAALLLNANAQTSVNVTCTSSPCSGNVQSIKVSVTVTTAPPALSVTSSLLSFSASSTSPQPLSQTLGLQNVGGGTISVNSVTPANSFITVTNAPSSIGAGPAVLVTVTANPAGLAAGFYQSSISVVTSAGSVTVPVTLLIAANAIMTLNPAGLQFQSVAGFAPGNPGGSFQVSVSGNPTVNWTAAVLSPPIWLTLNTTGGTSTSATPGTVNFSINSNAASLAPQAYYASIQVTSDSVIDSPQTFIVVLNVASATSPVTPNPAPSGLLFVAGSSAPASQTVQVYASSSTTQIYQASSDSPWLSVSPTSGSVSNSSPATSGISVNLSGLAAGIYTGGVSYAFSSAAVRTVNVTLLVAPGATSSDRTPLTLLPKAACVPARLVPTQTGLVNSFAQPTAWPTPLTVLVVNDCGQAVPNGQVVATFSNGDPPLVLNPTDTATGNYSNTWTPRNAAQQVNITATATSGPLTGSAQINGQVTPNAAPLLNQNGTLDAFAIAAEPGVPLAPGMIVQIYGSNFASQPTPNSVIPLPTNLNQTSVLIGGVLAPLYYVSPGQVNAQVPFELTPGKPYQVIVSANGALSLPAPIQLSADAPGILQFASGQIIAQHGTTGNLVLETSPAAPGEYLVLYAAGLGLTSPNVLSGNASPQANALDSATLTLNGATVTNIIYAGLTPTLVGLYQVNFQVPANAPNGDLQLVLTQSSGISNSTILPVHN